MVKVQWSVRLNSKDGCLFSPPSCRKKKSRNSRPEIFIRKISGTRYTHPQQFPDTTPPNPPESPWKLSPFTPVLPRLQRTRRSRHVATSSLDVVECGVSGQSCWPSRPSLSSPAGIQVGARDQRAG